MQEILKKNLIIKKLFIIPVFIFLFYFQGHPSTAGFFYNISNPFHNVFYNFNNSNITGAKKQLKKLFKNKKYKNFAYINYGFILEAEGNFTGAEKYYRKALKNNEILSLVYLYNLYRKTNNKNTGSLLSALKNNMESYWIDYEEAVYYIRNNQKNNCIASLSRALDKGFYSHDLLINDNAFDRIRDSRKFKRLQKRAEKNLKKSKSIKAQIDNIEYEFQKNKPYGKIEDIEIAMYYEAIGKDRRALKILDSLIKTKTGFRDRCTALFMLARINAKKGNKRKAAKYLKEFTEMINTDGYDPTGFRDLISNLYQDIILNDRYLKSIDF